MYDMGYKTIRQIADELNVSRNAVSKRINGSLSISIEPHTKMLGKFKAISPKGVELIAQSFRESSEGDALNSGKGLSPEPGREATEKTTEKPDNVVSVDDVQSAALLDVIKSLTFQMESLTKQLESLASQVETERAHSREQTDKILSLASELAELSKNNQYLLRYEQSKTNPALLTTNEKPTQNSETNKRQGIFSRLFGRRV